LFPAFSAGTGLLRTGTIATGVVRRAFVLARLAGSGIAMCGVARLRSVFEALQLLAELLNFRFEFLNPFVGVVRRACARRRAEHGSGERESQCDQR